MISGQKLLGKDKFAYLFMKKKIVFLSGFRGSGKDATFKVLKDNLDYNIIRISIADTIKDIGADTYNFDRKLADDHFEKDKNVMNQEVNQLEMFVEILLMLNKKKIPRSSQELLVIKCEIT